MPLMLLIFIGALVGSSLLLNVLARGIREKQGLRDSDVQLIGQLRGRWVVLYATVGATLTSLASVYLFFLLQSSVFGWVTFVTLVALPAGALVAQILSKKALRIAQQDSDFKKSIENGMMTSIHCARGTRLTAELCRILTLVNLLAVIWLELKVLSQISVANLFPANPSSPVIISLISAGIIFFLVQYIVRFGMNGVVLTDALYWPLVILSVALIGVATFISSTGTVDLSSIAKSITPEIGPVTILAFVLNAVLINAIYQISRDDQWLRLSAFRDDSFSEDNPAAKSLFSSAILSMPIWFALIIIGLVIGEIVQEPNLTIDDIIQNSIGQSPVLIPVLLVGMFAAVMSTVDNQLFTARRLLSFDARENAVSDKKMNVIDSYVYSTGLGVIFFALTYVMQLSEANNSSLVFSCLGLPAVLFPAIFLVLIGRRSTVASILVPLAVYVSISVYGYCFSENVQLLAISAPPVSLCAGMIFGLLFTRNFSPRAQ